MSTWKHLKKHRELLPRYLVRAKVFEAIRSHFKAEGFHEVEAPILVPAPSNEPYLEVFETTLLDPERRETKGYLISSPEYALKKLLASGLPKIFQLAKCFRNGEGQSRLHNSEFTMLEWYRTMATYLDIMVDCEQLILKIADSLNKSPKLVYLGKNIDLTPPWQRLSVAETFKKYAEINVFDLFDGQKYRELAQQKGFRVSPETTGEQIYHQIFLNEIEPKLGLTKPTIIYDYPAALSSYAKVSRSDSRVVERFEFYIAGIELGNAFSELTDVDEQRRRLAKDQEERALLGRTKLPIDHEFLEALESGLPACAGIAVGVDRLVMLFANCQSIQETLFFPGNELFPSS